MAGILTDMVVCKNEDVGEADEHVLLLIRPVFQCIPHLRAHDADSVGVEVRLFCNLIVRLKLLCRHENRLLRLSELALRDVCVDIVDKTNMSLVDSTEPELEESLIVGEAEVCEVVLIDDTCIFGNDCVVKQKVTAIAVNVSHKDVIDILTEAVLDTVAHAT